MSTNYTFSKFHTVSTTSIGIEEDICIEILKLAVKRNLTYILEVYMQILSLSFILQHD